MMDGTQETLKSIEGVNNGKGEAGTSRMNHKQKAKLLKDKRMTNQYREKLILEERDKR